MGKGKKRSPSNRFPVIPNQSKYNLSWYGFINPKNKTLQKKESDDQRAKTGKTGK